MVDLFLVAAYSLTLNTIVKGAVLPSDLVLMMTNLEKKGLLCAQHNASLLSIALSSVIQSYSSPWVISYWQPAVTVFAVAPLTA